MAPGLELTKAEQEKEEAAIREVMDQVLDAYGNRDSRAMAEASHDQFITFARITRGKAEIEEFWSGKFKQWGDQKLEPSQDLGVEFLAPNVAVWRSQGAFIDRPGTDGKPLPPQKFVGANLYIKKAGKWRRATAFIMSVTDA